MYKQMCICIYIYIYIMCMQGPVTISKNHQIWEPLQAAAEGVHIDYTMHIHVGYTCTDFAIDFIQDRMLWVQLQPDSVCKAALCRTTFARR